MNIRKNYYKHQTHVVVLLRDDDIDDDEDDDQEYITGFGLL